MDGAAGNGFSVQATPEISAVTWGAARYRLAYHRPFVLPKRDDDFLAILEEEWG